MKKTIGSVDFQFYPCETPYTGCEPRNNYQYGDCSAPSTMTVETQEKSPYFGGGDCIATSR